MPNPLIKLLTGPIDSVIGAVGGVIDSVTTTDEEREEAKRRLAEIQNAARSQVLEHAEAIAEAQRDIIVQELKQDDKYTKRARPSLVYVGLGAMVINHIVLPWTTFFLDTAADLPTIELPGEFWWGWTGVVGAWAVGRSVEKVKRDQGKPMDRITRTLTGARD